MGIVDGDQAELGPVGLDVGGGEALIRRRPVVDGQDLVGEVTDVALVGTAERLQRSSRFTGHVVEDDDHAEVQIGPLHGRSHRDPVQHLGAGRSGISDRAGGRFDDPPGNGVPVHPLHLTPQAPVGCEIGQAPLHDRTADPLDDHGGAQRHPGQEVPQDEAQVVAGIDAEVQQGERSERGVDQGV